MFKKITSASVSMVQRLLPDAFIFAVMLTILTFILNLIVTGQTAIQLVLQWGNGFWSLLGFTMQMASFWSLATRLPAQSLLKTPGSHCKNCKDTESGNYARLACSRHCLLV